MRILFAASPSIAVPSLEALVRLSNDHSEIEVAAVLTNPDAPRGRKGAPLPSEIGEAALRLRSETEFEVLKPLKLDASIRERIASLKPDILVSFAYGRIFGPKFLALFPLGGINVHPSLLPKYRGPSPVQAAILNRDTVTGISIQTLAPEMDSGDIIASKELQLTGSETAASLSSVISEAAALMLPGALLKIAAGNVKAVKQNDSGVSYCRLITREDGLIDWSLNAREIEAKIRAFTPWPLCRTIHNGRELFILKANVLNRPAAELNAASGQVLGIDNKDGILIQTGDGVLCVAELQYQAKKALHWRDFLNGARDFSAAGVNRTRLGQEF